MATTSARRAVSAATFGLVRVRRLPRRLTSVGAIVVLAALATACTASEAAPEAPPGNPVLAEGREVYVNNCVNCHGPTGNGGVGSKLTGGRVIERYPEIADQIALVSSGVRAMPSFESKLSEAEIDAVVRYSREVLAEAE